MWEPINEQEFVMKEYFLPSTPLPHHPDIFHDFFIPVESCENLASVDVTTNNNS